MIDRYPMQDENDPFAEDEVENTWKVISHHYIQPYECSTKIGAEVDSKGNIKPNAQVTITRKFEDAGEIVDCVNADVSRGVDEVTEAIKEVIRKYKDGSE